MLTQKIIGTQYKKVKYHGQVKFLIFECNNCHKHFSKMESYSKKQLKIHKHACCFCSPKCRDAYFRKQNKQKSKSRGNSHKKDSSLFGWINKILGS
ncbi:hypothetical protein A2W14_04055 [Candidatus Gottesmanbacteria bacterium RBG_16_37_8]|uniref:Uncharacterized protein n=1 Tax=Candidatus Gottesmanbacteria bacterium RBG_16_37_8 TaxID=1798371 RepID=A0A1F5YTX2_9BACT|nr:MAG: hypothetical protein A2W14_04055 [Candidatus Gottesmanbacteria bacterium RBG_16_37_8]